MIISEFAPNTKSRTTGTADESLS
eukprot:COSAG05_NODE_12694_length_458_cov_0.891365_1_plen_23_part_10